MSTVIYHTADFLLYTIHLIVIGTNIFGWIFKKTRKIQLITILATTISWFVLGFWYGWGYCFLTDWEWEIKRKLGESNLPTSFVHYLTNTTLNLNISTSFLDTLTIILFIVALMAGIVANYMDYRNSSVNRIES